MVEWHAQNVSVVLTGLAESNEASKGMSKIIKGMKLPVAEDEAVDNRTIEEIMEQGAIVDLDKQPSFESLAGAFGGLDG